MISQIRRECIILGAAIYKGGGGEGGSFNSTGWPHTLKTSPNLTQPLCNVQGLFHVFWLSLLAIMGIRGCENISDRKICGPKKIQKQRFNAHPVLRQGCACAKGRGGN
jgi:hypothetical protein